MSSTGSVQHILDELRACIIWIYDHENSNYEQPYSKDFKLIHSEFLQKHMM